MVSREEGRRQVQTALARHLLDSGLSRTSLRQLAGAAGISDRMLLLLLRRQGRGAERGHDRSRGAACRPA